MNEPQFPIYIARDGQYFRISEIGCRSLERIAIANRFRHPREMSGFRAVTGAIIPVADGVREFLLAASPEFLAELRRSTLPRPMEIWLCHCADERNSCDRNVQFTGPPDPGGVVKIAYSIAPAYWGKGYPTEAAMALVDYAFNSGRVKTVCAHTLPEFNASTRVLGKCDFKRVGEMVDPENNLVWRWERKRDTTSTSHRR